MGHLPFEPDVELTGPDRVVLDVLKKEYELHKDVPGKASIASADDSDDSTAKHSEFVTQSPEGKLPIAPNQQTSVLTMVHYRSVVSAIPC